jgi:subtilisin family serine protease
MSLVFFTGGAFAQKKSEKQLSGLWYQENSSKKAVNIDLNKAYSELLKNKEAKEIVVAVLDGGTEISHPDLKANIWHNPGEIAFNNIDDDNNGYVDDTVGWNFIGGKDGQMVHHDNLEITRLIRDFQKEFGDMEAEDINDPARRARYEYYMNLKTSFEQDAKTYSSQYERIKLFSEAAQSMLANMGVSDPTAEQVNQYEPRNDMEKTMKFIYKMNGGSGSFKELVDQLNEGAEQLKSRAEYHYNIKFDPRSIVGDNYRDASERYYGNNNVAGPDAFHGTHVAGIIGAVRGNGIGVEGVANKVKIMVVRLVPDGDERDKDVANGIRYAVDNGARIINMSFGKAYKYNKAAVDSAVAYASSKGVLLVHAAGNDGENNDISSNYPNDSLFGTSFAQTWIEVGASRQEKDQIATDFSNYGKANVDIFSPGFQINSTAPNGTYQKANGTSMAAPVLSGVAALVWSYYPELTAVQIKDILMQSSVKYKGKVTLPGNKKTKIKFGSLSVCGGVVNAFNALKMAESYSTPKIIK